MTKLIEFFLNNYKFTIILSLMMLVFGFMGIIKLNAESFPNVSFATAQITTRYEGATASDVETKITKPLEDKIREVSGLKDVKSISKTGLSKIIVRVDMDNEDEEEVLDELQKAVKEVNNLPADLRDDPIYMEINSEEFPAIEIAVVGSNLNRKRDLVVDHLKEELEDSKKIKNVRLVGFNKRQFNIRVDEIKMASLHIGIEEVLSKIKRRNISIPGGNLDSNGIRTLVRVEGKIEDVTELQNLVIRSNFSGKKILLKDIANVIDGEEDAKVHAGFNGKPSTFLIVNKKGGADTIKLVADVNVILARFRKQYKDQFKFDVYNNEALKVKKKLEILASNALSGLILVILFLFFFLPGKIGIVASMSLPLAVMATIGFMPIFGMNLDAVSILALVIALGMLVDNSVVISENFSRLMTEEGMNSHDAALLSVKQLWLPISTTAFTTIAAFLPMLVTKGIMGQFIKFIPIIVTISLLVSLGESFFFLPMRLSYAGKRMKKKTIEGTKDWFHKFILKFERFMDVMITKRYFVAFGFMAVIVGSLLLMSYGNKFMLFPPEQTEIYLGRIELPRGTNLKKMNQEMLLIESHLSKELGKWTRGITTRAGVSSMGPTDPKGASGQNHGLFIIYASDFAKYNIYYTKFLAKLRTIKSKNAKTFTFEAMANGPPVGEPINATFRSNNAKSLEAVVENIIQKLRIIPGILDLRTDDILGEEEIHVNIDYAKADQLGLNVNSIGSTIRTSLSGTMISKVTLKNKEIDLNVRYLDDYRITESNIKNIKTMDKMGNLVPISTVASLSRSNGSHEIKRFDFKRSKTITGSIEESKITSVIANKKLEEFFNEISEDYPDVTLVFGGENESTKESMQSLGQALIIALIGIFGLLVFLFKSYLRPLIIMSTIPLGLIGFSIAFYFHNKPISFLAMIGVIGLAGIIVNSGIVLISFIDQLKSEGKLELHDILVKASGLRLRAVLVTSLTTVSGLIPTAYGIGGSDAMLVPMTLAMAWGLTSGTFFTLIWVPCAYAILEDLGRFVSRLTGQGRTA